MEIEGEFRPQLHIVKGSQHILMIYAYLAVIYCFNSWLALFTIEYRISNHDIGVTELRRGHFDIPCSIFCGSEKVLTKSIVSMVLWARSETNCSAESINQ